MGWFLFRPKQVLDALDFLDSCRQALSTDWVRVLVKYNTGEYCALTGVEYFAQFTDEWKFLYFVFVFNHLEDGVGADGLTVFEFALSFNEECLFEGFGLGRVIDPNITDLKHGSNFCAFKFIQEVIELIHKLLFLIVSLINSELYFADDFIFKQGVNQYIPGGEVQSILDSDNLEQLAIAHFAHGDEELKNADDFVLFGGELAPEKVADFKRDEVEFNILADKTVGFGFVNVAFHMFDCFGEGADEEVQFLD